MLLLLKCKVRGECLTFYFDGELPEVLLINFGTNSWVNDYEIGLEGSLRTVLSVN